MKFWTTLRWVGVVLFALLLLSGWLGPQRSSADAPDPQARPAPPIIHPPP